MRFKVYRDCDHKARRKVVIELYTEQGVLLDRRRMFGLNIFGFFKARLEAKKHKMLELGKLMLEGSN